MSSEESEMWKSLREDSKEKRWNNLDSSLNILKKSNIDVKCLNESNGHYRIDKIDFWPTTGKFYNHKTKKYGRGVFNLIRLYKNEKKVL